MALIIRNACVLLLAPTQTSCSFPGPFFLLLSFIFFISRRRAVNLPILRIYVKKFCFLGRAATVHSASVLSHGVKAGGGGFFVGFHIFVGFFFLAQNE